MRLTHSNSHNRRTKSRNGPRKNKRPARGMLGRTAVFHCQGDRSTLRGCSAVAISHRNRKPVHKPGRSTRGHSSGSYGSSGACGNGACGNGDGSTSAHSRRWARQRSTRARRHRSVQQRSKWAPEHSSSLRKPAHSNGSYGSSGACGNGDGSTSGRSTREPHSTTLRPGRSTTVRAHNTRARNNHRQTGGLPLAKRRAQTGRPTAGPATRSGISWTELLNRNFGDFTSPFATQPIGPLAHCSAKFQARRSGIDEVLPAGKPRCWLSSTQIGALSLSTHFS